jgi:GABA(A) receptor-associated protein
MNNLINNVNKYYKNQENNKIITTGFKSKHSFEKRLDESMRILKKYPERIPIICERLTIKVAEIDRSKYLCPNDLSLGNFVYVIRKRIKIAPEEAIYLFINERILPVSKILGEIYEKHKDEDGFLYIKYDSEATFG